MRSADHPACRVSAGMGGSLVLRSFHRRCFRPVKLVLCIVSVTSFGHIDACCSSGSMQVKNFSAEVCLTPSADSSIRLIPHVIYDPLEFFNLRQLSTVSGREGYSGTCSAFGSLPSLGCLLAPLHTPLVLKISISITLAHSCSICRWYPPASGYAAPLLPTLP